jgi:hypothetical protein
MSRRNLAVAAIVLCISAVLLGAAASPARAQVLRGTMDGKLCIKGTTGIAARVDFMADTLHTQLLRFDLKWTRLEPQQGVYDQAYIDQLAQTFQDAASHGIKVIITLYDVPKWASDRSLWQYVPPTYTKGIYHPFYPPAPSHLIDFQHLATKLASTFGDDVLGYEPLNEPNAWFSLYPQRTSSDDAFGVRQYAAMLTAFSQGIRIGDPHALVIAGSTAPNGRNNALGTSPLRFAQLLKTMVSPSVFDAYSHHPYTVGGTKNIAPEAPPLDPVHTVSLGNISVLLKLFPTKPFYITEYGYYTVYRLAMGIYVNQPTQALFLQRAYRYVARFPQIKALVWFPYHDVGAVDPPPNNGGVYSGLVTSTGAYKLSWFAFSGHNKLTLTVARKAAGSFRLAGKLSTSLGGLSGKSLTVSRRLPGGKWRVVKTLKTDGGGAYHLWVKAAGRAWFRVAWTTVVHSTTVEVNA